MMTLPRFGRNGDELQTEVRLFDERTVCATAGLAKSHGCSDSRHDRGAGRRRPLWPVDACRGSAAAKQTLEELFDGVPSESAMPPEEHSREPWGSGYHKLANDLRAQFNPPHPLLTGSDTN